MKVSIVLLFTAVALIGLIGRVSGGNSDEVQDVTQSENEEYPETQNDENQTEAETETQPDPPKVTEPPKKPTSQPKPQGTQKPKPQATQTPKPQATQTPKPQATQKPTPQATQKPTPRAVTKPKSETDEKPQRQASPQPKQNPANRSTSPSPQKNNNTPNSRKSAIQPPEELLEPLDVNAMLTSLTKLPPNVIQAAQNNLRNLSKILGNYPDLQSYFDGFSSLLGNRNLIMQILNGNQQLPFLSSLSFFTPLFSAVKKIAGVGLKTGGAIINFGGDIVDFGFEKAKDVQDIISSKAQLLGGIIPGMTLVYDPIHALSQKALDTAHVVIGDGIQNLGEGIQDAGDILITESDMKRLRRRRSSRPNLSFLPL